MADPFVAEIRMYSFNFAPKGWAFCNGQLLPISQNTALFSLLGTNYGGDGKATFGLPNFQGSAPMFWGQGPGLTDRVIGETAGSDSVTLLVTEMPAHSHGIGVGTGNPAESNTPLNNVLSITNRPVFTAANVAGGTMSLNTLGNTGGSQPHNNMQPYLTVNFCIAMQGIFPPRG